MFIFLFSFGLQNQSFTVPMEFQNLAWCADQSRKNTSDLLSRRRIYAEKSKQPIAAAPSDDKIPGKIHLVVRTTML